MRTPEDAMGQLAQKLIATAAEAGAPDIIVFNDLDHDVIKVAHVLDRCAYIVGDYATLEEADTAFPAAFGVLSAMAVDQRPAALWFKDAILMLMHINLLPSYSSTLLNGAAIGSIYALIYINNVWRLSTEAVIWIKTISEML
jgi:hypothetical protein